MYTVQEWHSGFVNTVQCTTVSNSVHTMEYIYNNKMITHRLMCRQSNLNVKKYGIKATLM